MATPNYDIDYNDKRLTDVTAAKDAALNKNDVEFGNMIADGGKIYDQQIANSEKWEKTQIDLQNQKTDFAIDEINQQKAQAKKDYTKEQAVAYADWQKQSDPYGVEAEKLAASGLTGSGYHESSLVSMYNTYQNRVATAREAYVQLVQDYNNAITEARLNNSSILAEIAAKANEQRLTLTLESLQYKHGLLQQQATRRAQIEDFYHTVYQDVLDQMNTEKAFEEGVRQFNESLEEKKRQFDYTAGIDGEGTALKGNDTVEGDKTGDKAGNPLAGAFYGSLVAGQNVSNNTNDSGTKLIGDNAGVSKETGQLQGGKMTTGNKKSDTIIKTKYYFGPIAEDVGGYGYMGKDNNGVAYQPKGVVIDGKAYKLSKVGKTVEEFTKGKQIFNPSGVNVKNQNVWTANGLYFVWDGTANEYYQIYKT